MADIGGLKLVLEAESEGLKRAFEEAKSGLKGVEAVALSTGEAEKKAFHETLSAGEKAAHDSSKAGKKGYHDVADAAGKSADAQKKAAKEVDEALRGTGGALASLSSSWKLYTAAATGALAAVGVSAVKAAADFEEGFSKVATLIPENTARIKELENDVLNLSPAVGKTTEDLTGGLYEIVSAFGDAADSSKKLEVAAKAATAGGATTKEAIKLLSAVTKGYGDTSAAAQQKVSDLAFTTLKLGQTSMSELAASIQRVTAMSNELNVSQEEMFAVFSSGTGVIGGAAEVSTQLAAVYNELMKPGAELTATFERLGVASGSELIEKFGGLTGALGAVKDVADATGSPVNTLFGSVEAGRLALYATGAGAQKLKNDLKAMGKAAGASAVAFKEASEGGVNSFGFQMQQLKLSAHAFAVRLGQELIPSVGALLNPVVNVVEFLAKMDGRALTLIVSLGKLAVLFGSTFAACMLLKKGFQALKEAKKELDAAMAANPWAAAVTGIVLVVGALKELFAWFEKNRRKMRELAKEAAAKQAAEMGEAVRIRELGKEYASLRKKQSEKPTNTGAIQLKQKKEELEKILKKSLPDDISKPIDSFVNEALSGAKEAAENAAKKLEATQANLEKIEKAIEFKKSNLHKSAEASPFRGGKSVEEIYEKKVEKDEKKVTGGGKVRRDEATGALSLGADMSLGALRELYEAEEKALVSAKAARAALLDLRKEDFEVAEKTLDIAIEETEETKKTAKAVAEKPRTRKDELADLINAQKERLKILDDAHSREVAIADDYRAQALISEAQHAQTKKEIDKNYYKDRKALLATFVKERMEAGSSLSKSMKAVVTAAGTTIKDETARTLGAIGEAARREMEKEVASIREESARLKEESARNIDAIESGASLEKKKDKDADIKKYLPDGYVTAEMKRQAFQKEIEWLQVIEQKNLEKIKELTEEDAELNRGKIEAIKEQNRLLAEQQVAASVAKDSTKASRAEKAAAVASKVERVGGAVNGTVQQVATIATDIIGIKQKEAAQKLSAELLAIEREKNEKLRAMEDEYADWKEEKARERQEREEAREEEEYERKQEALTRDLQELQGAFDQETNIEKARNLEKELEAKRAQKAEEARKKAEADAERKRQKEERKEEVARLNAKALAEWQFQVATIEAQNAGAAAQAELAKQSAVFEKIQTITALTIKAAVEAAEAAASYAAMNIPGGIAHTMAATLAGVQIGVVAATPLPPPAVAAPTPPAPRPIKFARGGIVEPTSGGTPFKTQGGKDAVAGEAGAPEIILPVTQANLEAVFKAQGVAVNGGTSIAPVYNITIVRDEGQNTEEAVMAALRSRDRDLLEIVEKAKRQTYID